MKKVMLGLLFLGGFAMAAEIPPVQQQPLQTRHVSYFQRIALQTQTPAVHFTKHHRAKQNYIVTENKGTIVAMVPYGK